MPPTYQFQPEVILNILDPKTGQNLSELAVEHGQVLSWRVLIRRSGYPAYLMGHLWEVKSVQNDVNIFGFKMFVFNRYLYSYF